MRRSTLPRQLKRSSAVLLLLLAGLSAQAVLAADATAPVQSAPAALSASIDPIPSIGTAPPLLPGPPVAKRARFEQERASQDARQVADRVVDSADNHGMPFVIVDKKDARVYVFDATGLLRGAAPALLGLAIGDDAVPGIGDRKLSSIRPAERTTPAGRFVAAMDRNLHGAEIIWVDYDSGVSLHRVVPGTAAEHRAQRLASVSTLDNRISFGCINVPAKFFDSVVLPAFTGTDGVVYVLPETRPVQTVFSAQGAGALAAR